MEVFKYGGETVSNDIHHEIPPIRPVWQTADGCADGKRWIADPVCSYEGLGFGFYLWQRERND